MCFVHVLHEVFRSKEHASESLFHLVVRESGTLVKNEDLKILPDPFLALTPPHDQVIVCQKHVYLLPKSPNFPVSETGEGKWLVLTDIGVFRALIKRPFAFVESGARILGSRKINISEISV